MCVWVSMCVLVGGGLLWQDNFVREQSYPDEGEGGVPVRPCHPDPVPDQREIILLHCSRQNDENRYPVPDQRPDGVIRPMLSDHKTKRCTWRFVTSNGSGLFWLFCTTDSILAGKKIDPVPEPTKYTPVPERNGWFVYPVPDPERQKPQPVERHMPVLPIYGRTPPPPHRVFALD